MRIQLKETRLETHGRSEIRRLSKMVIDEGGLVGKTVVGLERWGVHVRVVVSGLHRRGSRQMEGEGMDQNGREAGWREKSGMGWDGWMQSGVVSL